MHRTGHILLLHHSEGERLRTVADWFRAGLRNDERIVYVDVAGWGAYAILQAFENRGLDLRQVRDAGRFRIVTLEDFAAPDGLERLLEESHGEGYASARVACRTDVVGEQRHEEEYLALEARIARACHQLPVSVMCQYDARTTTGERLATAVSLHPDWVYESGLNVQRRGRHIAVMGNVDSWDGEVLARSLRRMVQELPADSAVELDLTGVANLTAAASRALLEGTEAFREKGGRVRCHPPEGKVGWLLRVLDSEHHPHFTLV